VASPGRPRRILIIVENLPVPFDRRVWQEATTLKAAGYEVAVICPRSASYPRAYESLNGVHIYRHPLPFEADGPAGYVLEYGTALVAELALALVVLLRHGFDVIHACNPPDDIFLVGGLFKLFGKRFVFDHHDLNPELYESKFGRRGALYRVVCWLERFTFRTADMVISTNESYRRVAIERGGVPPERVHVVRSGPSLERLRILPPVPRWKRGRTFLVGYVGVMGKQEGIHFLLEAARDIVYVRGRRDVQFCLVGGGSELPELRRLATELGLDDYVTFTGRVGDDVLLEVLNTADVCVNPDPYDAMNDKSTMNKIMEYMALGKPIVQFDLTEGRVSAQGASRYAERNNPADLAAHVLSLLDQPAERERMGAIGRARVANVLEWKYEAVKLLAAYDRLFA
jgi:glycosyltransferase involved in cell wall biosynthesis